MLPMLDDGLLMSFGAGAPPPATIRRLAIRAPLTLTPRERQIVDLLLRGLTYKRIAREIGALVPGHTITESTVRVHVKRVAWKIINATGDARWKELPAKAAVLIYFASER